MENLTVEFKEYDMHEYVDFIMHHAIENIHYSMKKGRINPIKTYTSKKFDLNALTSRKRNVLFAACNRDMFDNEDYLTIWKNRFEEFLDENATIKKSIQGLQSSCDDEYLRLMSNLFEELELKTRNSYDKWHKMIMAEYLESNITMELYSSYNLSYITKLVFMKSFRADLNELQKTINQPNFDNVKRRLEVKKFKKERKKFIYLFMKVFSSEYKLKFFLKTLNAEKLDDMFETRPIILKRKEIDQFDEYFSMFKGSVLNLIRYLDKKSFEKEMSLFRSKSKAFVGFEESIRRIFL